MNDNDAQFIGKNALHPRVVEKALGAPIFAADLGDGNQLVLKARRAGVHHAEIVSIDTREAEAVPGVVRIFTSADIPGRNAVGIIGNNKDWPILAVGKVRSKADAVALVAAETEAAAEAAVKAIRIEWKELPAVLDPEAALLPDAPKIHESGNLLYTRLIKKGDVEAGFAASCHILENEYETPMIEHCYIETEAGIGYFDEDGIMTIEVATQNTHYDQADICAVLDVPEEQLRVVQAVTGGGFGGKLDISVHGFIGLALLHLRRPVRYFYTREESFLASGKRHGMKLKLKTGVDRNGKLLAVQGRVLSDGGAYGSYGIAVVTRTGVHLTGPYECPNVDVEVREIYTNHPFCCAMRGFGTPQGALAHESQMDMHGQALGLDPIEIRLRNALVNGSEQATGQIIHASAGLTDCLKALRPYYDEAMSVWMKEKPGRPSRKRGVGVGAMWYGCGNTAAANPAAAHIEIDQNGQLTLYSGAADIGQGSTITLLQIAAEVLGVEPAKFKSVIADTKYTENAGASSASRQTYISGNATLQAATLMADALLERAGDQLQSPKEDLALAGGKVTLKSNPAVGLPLAQLAGSMHTLGLPMKFRGYFDPDTTPLDPKTGQGCPYGTYAFACQLVQLEVDVLTGEIDIHRVVAAHDVGRMINPANLVGQVCGGVAMGLGYGILEEFAPGVESLKDYHICTSTDVPEIVPILVETPEPTGPFGAKGIGEPSLIPTAPAAVNALEMAIGERIYALPATLERVMEACQKAGWFEKLEV